MGVLTVTLVKHDILGLSIIRKVDENKNIVYLESINEEHGGQFGWVKTKNIEVVKILRIGDSVSHNKIGTGTITYITPYYADMRTDLGATFSAPVQDFSLIEDLESNPLVIWLEERI